MVKSSLINGRIEWIDRLRALAFFLVVVGHTTLPQEMRTLIYSFHMPLFFCISGMTTNPEKLIRTPLWDIVVNNFKRLMIPFFWLNFLCFPLWVLTYKIFYFKPNSLIKVFFATFYSNGNVYHMPSNALWFLTVLFFSNILIACLFKLAKGNYFTVGIGVIVTSILGYLDKNTDRIWHINVVFTAVAFMFIGLLLMRLYKKYHKELRRVKLFTRILIFIILTLLWLFFADKNGYISMNSNNFGNNYFLFYLASITGSLMFIVFAVHLTKFKIFSYIGVNTMLYLGIHCPIIRCLEQAFPIAMTKVYITVPVAILIYLAIAPLCSLFNKYFPYAVGKSSSKEKLSKLKYTNIIFFIICFILPTAELIGKILPSMSPSLTITLSLLFAGFILIGISLLTQRFIPFIYLVKKDGVKK